ncbi:DUF998 domain-containing protein [Streptosporangium sp. NPDC049304]|uniref:DUF998 domain-containing protein n=1 Tax=Streptosporangium sp. NPDC049304 TaxID=3154830 RepID=UPI00342CB95D
MDSSHLTRKLVVATHAGLVGSLVGATALHIGWAKQVDTVRHTVSDYALSKNTAAVFAGTVASLSVGSAALLAGLVRSRLPIGAPATALLGVWCGGMTLTGIFRTDPQGGVPTARGLTHRYAAGGAIATLPAVGLLIARRLQGMPGWERKARPLRRVSWASAVGGLAFLVTHVSATVEWGWGHDRGRIPADAAARRAATRFWSRRPVRRHWSGPRRSRSCLVLRRPSRRSRACR